MKSLVSRVLVLTLLLGWAESSQVNAAVTSRSLSASGERVEGAPRSLRLVDHYERMDKFQTPIKCTYPNGGEYQILKVRVEAFDNGTAFISYQLDGTMKNYWSPRYYTKNAVLRAFLDVLFYESNKEAFGRDQWLLLILDHIATHTKMHELYPSWRLTRCD